MDEMLNELCQAAHAHSMIVLGEPLVDDFEEWLEDASAELKVITVTEYLEGTV